MKRFPFCFWCLLLFPGLSLAVERPVGPVLRLETGMHTAVIKRIAVDGAEKLLVTGSDDKTVRLWDLQSGSLLRTLRLPIDRGNGGRVYAVAISPDGTTVAAAGWTRYRERKSQSVYLFDTTSGQMTGQLAGLENVVLHLAFSADGQWLGASLGEGGIRIYHKKAGGFALQAEDHDYGNAAYWLDFTGDGGGAGVRLLTSCWDGLLRLYDLEKSCGKIRPRHKQQAGGGREPYAAVFSPDGSRIAVGYADSTAVTVHNGTTLLPLFAADTDGVDNGSLNSVAWSADGKRLYAAGRYDDGRGVELICCWDKGGKGRRHQRPGTTNTILDLRLLGDNRLIFAGGGPVWGVQDKDGSPYHTASSFIADFRGSQNGLQLSHDGRELAFSYRYGGSEPARFSMAALSPSVSTPLHGPRTSGLRDENMAADWEPALKRGEKIRSGAAIAPDGRSFLLGADWYLRSFDARGKLRWQQPVPGAAWEVNISEDGRLAVAACSDGTIRWYRYSDGTPLLSFFPHNDARRWVAWTPSGYYAASIGGDELVGWHLNRGLDAAANFFPASRFHSVYYRPDVVRQILITLDEGKALAKADSESSKQRQQIAIDAMLPPVIRLISPQSGSGFSSGEITLHYQLESPSGEPVTSIEALVDGVAVSVPRTMQRKKREGQGSMNILVPLRDCEITLIASNRYAASTPATIHLQWQGSKAAKTVQLPRLYILAIGVGDYADSDLRLDFPGKDATDFTQIMTKQKGKVYRDVETRLLTDRQATRDAIMAALSWLEKEVTSDDISILFLAGHGVNDRNGDYYFLPQDAGPESLHRRGVSYLVLKNIISTLPGKKIFFVDTCFSGNIMGRRQGGDVDFAMIANELSAIENRVVVFTSSSGREYSLENRSWNNGAFTKALVEGLSGKANILTTDPAITVKELDLYISERVRTLTDGRQTPIMILPRTVPNFPVAMQ